MSWLTRQSRAALALIGIGTATVLLPVPGRAQQNAGAQMGTPSPVDVPARIPAVTFRPPQSAPADSLAPLSMHSVLAPRPMAQLAEPTAAVAPAALGFREQPPAAPAAPAAPPAPDVVPSEAGTPLLPALPVPVAQDGAVKNDNSNSMWLKNPPVSVVPRPGFFAVPPTGPGFYSLRDLLTDNYREKAPSFGYPRSAIMFNGMFDTDWRYVDQPGYQPDFLEQMHRIHLGDNWLFATGGEFRFRYNNEINSRLSGKDNQYDLNRLRLFTDLWYKNTFRIFVEFLSAGSSNQNLPPTIFDRDQADILNAFIDYKFFEDSSGTPWYVRGGRQQLLFGSQRLLSPLDWVNTLRTFDGVRAFRHSENLDIDAFWARPVIPNSSGWSSSDQNENLAGTWLEYRPTKTRYFDLYYLYFSDTNHFNLKTKTPPTVGNNPLAPYSVNTWGSRYAGNFDGAKNVLFDFEDMLQLGRSSYTNGDIVAGASTSGLGYNFANLPMNPTIWGYFDWASGSSNIKANSGQTFTTFNQLFPFGHYYFGWLDYVSRMNIQDWNFHLYLYPTKWITFNTQFHVFQLDSPRDALYNAGGAILRYDPTGKAGRDIGQELDFIMNFTLTPRQNLLVAYGHLFEGRFLRSTGTGGTGAETTWVMYTVRW